jgi:hypothetical protein
LIAHIPKNKGKKKKKRKGKTTRLLKEELITSTLTPPVVPLCSKTSADGKLVRTAVNTQLRMVAFTLLSTDRKGARLPVVVSDTESISSTRIPAVPTAKLDAHTLPPSTISQYTTWTVPESTILITRIITRIMIRK